MVSDEKSNTASIETENTGHDQKIITLQDQPGSGLFRADRFRGMTRSLVVDALATLSKMAKDCHEPPELLENYYQLYHCLDYLKRFCDGKV